MFTINYTKPMVEAKGVIKDLIRIGYIEDDNWYKETYGDETTEFMMIFTEWQRRSLEPDLRKKSKPRLGDKSDATAVAKVTRTARFYLRPMRSTELEGGDLLIHMRPVVPYYAEWDRDPELFKASRSKSSSQDDDYGWEAYEVWLAKDNTRILVYRPFCMPCSRYEEFRFWNCCGRKHWPRVSGGFYGDFIPKEDFLKPPPFYDWGDYYRNSLSGWRDDRYHLACCDQVSSGFHPL